MRRLKRWMYGVLTVLFLLAGIYMGGQASEAASGKWKQDKKGYYYQYSDGSYVKNSWIQYQGKWYHFNARGYMQTGWQQIGKKWYYFNSAGAMQIGWVQIGSKWYYFNSSGVMQTGWLSSGGNWYYLNSSGVMQTGWVQINSKWYYFNSSGIMLKNQKIGSYYVGADGAMTSEPKSGNNSGSSSGNNSGNSGNSSGGFTKTTGSGIWVAGSGKGKKYHSRPGCSNMIDPIEISKEQAEKLGYTPCAKCH